MSKSDSNNTRPEKNVAFHWIGSALQWYSHVVHEGGKSTCNQERTAQSNFAFTNTVPLKIYHNVDFEMSFEQRAMAEP
jgi:hypothetical protein